MTSTAGSARISRFRSPLRWTGRVPERSRALELACLAAIAAIAAVGTGLERLVLLLAGLLGLGTVVAAMRNPNVLFYAYCAAIPLSDVLPPGPAGTIGRIAGLVFFIGYLVLRPNSLRPGIIPVVGWLYVGWTLASTLWAVDTDSSFEAWISLGQLFAITVLVASIVATRPELARGGLVAYAATATATALVAALPALQGSVDYLSRASAFGGQNPAGFASLLVPAVVLLMGEAQARGCNRALRILAFAALATCIIAVGLSGTRSAWLGIAVALVAWIALQRDARQLTAVVAVGAGLVLLMAIVPGASAFLLERTGTSITSGGSGRTDIWAVGLQIFANQPIFGVGFGNFPLAFTPNVIAQVAGASTGGPGRDPHSVLLGAFAETGLVGGALLMLFFGTALVRLRGNGLTNVIRAALIGLFVESFFLETLLRKHLWLFVGVALGLAVAGQIVSARSSRPTSGLIGFRARGRTAGDPAPARS